jgi:DNA-binding SARP family transcriptional activator
MSLQIGLLGTPSVTIDGVPRPAPRGKKAWGLLAYLVMAGPARRQELARLLFDEADDPLGALRWNLAEIRRLLSMPDQLAGDLPALVLPPDALVDVRTLETGTWLAAIELPHLGRELLEGVNVVASPAFDAWLLAERRHVQAQTESILHEAALARLASGDGEGAIDLAARLVAMNAFEENHQELLIRAYAATGDREAAARQLAACVELFRRELGVEPGPTVVEAANATGTGATATAVTGRAAARAQLDAGEAAIGAGAIDAGLECLRRAAAEAHASGDLELKARALLALGSALAHAARGRDEEASAALHGAIVIAERIERGDLAAAAHRQLAWVDVLRARFARARVRIDQARTAGGTDPFDVGLEGAIQYQQGSYRDGFAMLERALAATDDPRLQAMALGELGLIRFVLGEHRAARESLEAALERTRWLAWNAYLPYPEAMVGLLDLAEGDSTAARDRLEHAFALGCQIRDCCWEGIAAGGLALLHESDGNLDEARTRFSDAVYRSAREPDAWLWGHAFVLDMACAFGVRRGIDETRRWVADLETLAARTMMREFLARAYLHRFDLGDASGLASAELVGAEVDNPSLQARIAGRIPSTSSP